MMMDLLMNVKFTLVLSFVKMNGEMNTVLVTDMPIVLVHSNQMNVMVP